MDAITLAVHSHWGNRIATARRVESFTLCKLLLKEHHDRKQQHHLSPLPLKHTPAAQYILCSSHSVFSTLSSSLTAPCICSQLADRKVWIMANHGWNSDNWMCAYVTSLFTWEILKERHFLIYKRNLFLQFTCEKKRDCDTNKTALFITYIKTYFITRYLQHISFDSSALYNYFMYME